MTDVCYAGTSTMLQMVYTAQCVMNKSKTRFNGSFNNSALCIYVRYIMITKYKHHLYFIHMQNNCCSKLLCTERMSERPSYPALKHKWK